jgi:hypothetical protein
MPSKIKRPRYSMAPPTTEVECKEMQEKFLSPDCTPEVRDQYFLLLRTYARSLALKEIKRKGIFLPPERVDEICTDATLLLMRQYSKEGWKVLSSFAGALYWKILEAMYKQAKEESMYSLNTTFNDDSDSKEVMDLVCSNSCLPWQSRFNSKAEVGDAWDELSKEVNESTEEVKGIVDDAYNMLPYTAFLKFLPWFLLQLRKSRVRNNQKVFKELFLTGKEEDAFNILLLETKDRIEKHIE